MPRCNNTLNHRGRYKRFIGSLQEIRKMPLTEKQIRLAETIDEYVAQLVKDGGDDEEMLMTMHPYLDSFKQLLDSCTQPDMDQLCQRYDGFYRFAFLLERLAEGIANGVIPVPE